MSAVVTRLDQAPGPYELNGDSWQARDLEYWFPLDTYSLGRDMMGKASPIVMSGGAGFAQDPTGAGLVFYNDGASGSGGKATNAGALRAGRDYTVTCWFYPIDTNGAAFLGHQTDGGNDGWRIGYDSSELMDRTFGSVSVTNLNSLSATLNRWHFCAMSWRDGSGVIGTLIDAVDGTIDTQGPVATASMSATVPTQVTFGNSRDFTFAPMEGYLRDVRIYTRKMGFEQHRMFYQPATRWDLYRPLSYRPVVKAPAAAGGGTIVPQMMQHNHFAGGVAL